LCHDEVLSCFFLGSRHLAQCIRSGGGILFWASGVAAYLLVYSLPLTSSTVPILIIALPITLPLLKEYDSGSGYDRRNEKDDVSASRIDG
jgi:hypothetical protein